MTTNPPESINERLSRLETIFADMGEVMVAQNEAIASNKQNIDALTANVNRLAEQSYNFAEQTNQNINLLAQQAERHRELAEQTNQNINLLAQQAERHREQAERDRQQAAADRQQAAIDRQEFRQQSEQRQREIQQIWEYLRDRNGGSPPPQQ